MGLLNRIKHMVGMGVQLEVEVPYKHLTPGSQLTYSITLTTESEVVARTVTVEVLNGSAAPGAAGWGSGPALLTAPTLENVELTPAAPFVHSGALMLPEEAPLSGNDPDAPLYWALRVVVDLPMGVDPNAVVGFVVGPKTQFQWEVSGPMPLGIAGTTRAVEVVGTCTVVQNPELSIEGAQEAVRGLLPDALRDLLREYPDLLGQSTVSEQRLSRLSNELREILSPRLRESVDVPLDSISEITIQEIRVK